MIATKTVYIRDCGCGTVEVCDECAGSIGRARDAAVARRQTGNPQNVLKTLPEDSAARKQVPITTGLLDYFPLACAEVARHSFFGNEKHNPGQPLHWARGKSNDHADCIGRHLIQRGEWDIVRDENGEELYRVRHSAALAWRALAMLQEELEAEAGFVPEER